VWALLSELAASPVTEWRAGTDFAWWSTHSGLRVRARHTLHPEPQGVCRVCLELRMPGAPGSRVALFAGAITKRYLALEAACLAAYAQLDAAGVKASAADPREDLP